MVRAVLSPDARIADYQVTFDGAAREGNSVEREARQRQMFKDLAGKPVPEKRAIRRAYNAWQSRHSLSMCLGWATPEFAHRLRARATALLLFQSVTSSPVHTSHGGRLAISASVTCITSPLVIARRLFAQTQLWWR